MSRIYGVAFGSGDSRNYAGLSPTFVIFQPFPSGPSLTPPSIFEIGVSTGLYGFTFAPSATYTVFFQIDGTNTITDSSQRYIRGNLDPISAVDQQLGFIGDSYGTTVLPTTALGYIKRITEYLRGDANFNKTTGVWTIYPSGVTTTALEIKTLSNTTATVTKV